jgi:MarR family 2-MHQ and catechol resistance regulon transcriptional repressor
MISSFRLSGRLLHEGRILAQGGTARDRFFCAEAGLSLSQWNLMQTLWELGSAGMKVLAEELRLTQSTLTRVVDGLEKKNLAVRQPAKQDRRRVEVQLTPAGEEQFQELESRIRASCREILALLPGERREDAVEGLRQLAQATQRWVDRQRSTRKNAAQEPESRG